MSREEFERTKKIVAEFGRPGGVGEELQKKLLQRAEAKESWVSGEPCVCIGTQVPIHWTGLLD